MSAEIKNWTQDADAIVYQTCAACKAVWYFQRDFCPQCGTGAPITRQASGLGTVHARTLVARAPSEEWRAHAPYLIVLVDADEGFRLMAHGEAGLQIGERVRARFVPLVGRKAPFFESIRG